jgi:hypothetical protein
MHTWAKTVDGVPQAPAACEGSGVCENSAKRQGQLLSGLEHRIESADAVHRTTTPPLRQTLNQTSPTIRAPTAIVDKVMGKGSHETPRSWLQKIAPLSVPA